MFNKILLPTWVRYSLCVSALIMFSITLFTYSGKIELPKLLGSPWFLILWIVVFLIGFYSPKYGFKGFSKSNGDGASDGGVSSISGGDYGGD